MVKKLDSRIQNFLQVCETLARGTVFVFALVFLLLFVFACVRIIHFFKSCRGLELDLSNTLSLLRKYLFLAGEAMAIGDP